MNGTVLVVDDEPSIVELVEFNLKAAGFKVVSAYDGPAALEKLKQERPDLMILDLMLPGLDGLEVCRLVRQQSSMPILILTARGTELDRVLGLELGADDYLVKPFSPRELVARVKAIMRRTMGGTDAPSQVLRVGAIEVDRERRRVTVGGEEVELTPKEYQLLELFISHPGKVFSRQSLLHQLWEDDYYGDARTIDVHIHHLREKIEKDPGEPEYILTVRGVGYKFRERS
ncbi:MAG: response regulator transcription factor [Clostridia bacterium]|nr:response regulator transcription factor [Clostridia bacterium]